MPLAIAIGVAGIAGAGATLIASHDASSAASNAAAQNNALQEEIYNKNTALAQPYVTRGNAAGDELSGFLGLGGDPAKTQAAFQTYLNSTGYQFNKTQGIDAVNNDRAVKGLLGSGGTLKALDTFGTGLADTYGQQYVGNLENLQNAGLTGVGDVTGAGTHYADAVSANNNSAASASGNAALNSANAFNGLLGNALGAYALSRGGSSFGGGGNAFGGGGGAGWMGGA